MPSSSSRWSGRFRHGIHPQALRFTQSASFDWRLAPYDVMGSLAHARMLKKIGILTATELQKITHGLETILKEIQSGRFRFQEKWEDVHRNIEVALIHKIGSVGGKLHTARSRNDQVALDVRLYCRHQLEILESSVRKLERALLGQAREFLHVVMPGYTHLQRAQPILYAHHLLAYVEMLERDRERLKDIRRRVNVLPLGSGALAGTTFPLDRAFVARQLGFEEISHNSLDAVSDRDFAIELSAAGSLLMMHLSRFAEELVLWSSSEFSFIQLPENFCTGSSMMPQKMNPDVPELIRGKVGRVYGHLVSLLTLLKALPLSYNKDLQEDKEALFDLFETVTSSVDILSQVVEGMRPHERRMKEAAQDGFLLATDLADWLVMKGLDFRSSHEVTAKVVRYALEKEKDLKKLTLHELRAFSPLFTNEVFSYLDLKVAIDRRKVPGGTAKTNVIKEIRRVGKKINL